MANESESMFIIIIKRITKDQLKHTVLGILQSEKVQIYSDNKEGWN